MRVWALLLASTIQVMAFRNTIVAVVNDDIISRYELTQRLHLRQMLSGLVVGGTVNKGLEASILQTTIRERLKRQASAKGGITVSTTEVDDALKAFIKRSKKSLPSLERKLKAAGIPLSFLRAQIRDELAWTRLVQTKYRSQVASFVTDKRINRKLRLINHAKSQKHVLDIFIPPTTPPHLAEDTAKELVRRLREKSVSFATLAKKFSESPSAQKGGDIGWVTSGQLPPLLGQALHTLQVGEVSSPVKTDTGFHILKVVAQRVLKARTSTVLNLIQVNFPYTTALEKRDALGRAQRLLQKPTSCPEVRSNQTLSIRSLNRYPLDQTPTALKPLFSSLKKHRFGGPLLTPKGVLLFLLCDSHTVAVQLFSREQIQELLIQERLALLAQHLLTQLRQQSYISVRL